MTYAFPPSGLHKYSIEVYDACIKSFQALPITALVDKRFFCVHGGISPELDTLRDLDGVRALPSYLRLDHYRAHDTSCVSR